jgi:hypothetical protein
LASFLNAISLAVNLLGNDPNVHDDRQEWRDYAWVEPGYNSCIGTDKTGFCHAAHQKWDWKRNQWVDFAYKVTSPGKLAVGLTLTNNDPTDADDVCVTGLFLDAAGHDVTVFHENVHIGPEAVQRVTRTFSVSANFSKIVKTVVVGSKQCRDGATEDAALYAEVEARIGQF